jgi:hypothetical protein
MPRDRDFDDVAVLRMALVGYQIEQEKIDKKIHELQSLLKGRPSTFIPDRATTSPVKRRLSDAARDRIAAAQRKRWAKHRKLKAQAAKT